MRDSLKIACGLVLTTFTACFPEDERVIPSRTFTTIELLNDYSQAQYYQLATDSVVLTIQNSDWDLAFECSDTGSHILLNTANFMFAVLTDLSSVEDSLDSEKTFIWKWDSPDGNLDSTALSGWQGNPGRVYLINRGMLSPQFVKIRFEDVLGMTYRFVYQLVDDTNTYVREIPKDTSYHFVHFSFDSHAGLNAEPLKKDWDLHFSRYTYIFYQDDPDAPIPFADEYLPYIVVGTFSNYLSGVLTAEDRQRNFDDILLADTSEFDFQSAKDVIGWNWKVFNFSTYSIVEPLFFVIRATDGNYYKLRFANFYQSGYKGYPTFEVKKFEK